MLTAATLLPAALLMLIGLPTDRFPPPAACVDSPPHSTGTGVKRLATPTAVAANGLLRLRLRLRLLTLSPALGAYTAKITNSTNTVVVLGEE